MLLNGAPPAPRRRSPSADRMPRVVPQPASRTVYRPPLLLALLLAPVSLLARLVAGAVRLAASLFPTTLLRRTPLARPATAAPSARRELDPRDTAARFAREFAEAHGAGAGPAPPFLECGYAAAFDRAQRELRPLLVLLLSPEHDDAAPFARHVLLAPEVRALFDPPATATTTATESPPAPDGERVLLWAGSVRDAEPYQVARALRATRFPYAALLAPASASAAAPTLDGGALTVLARLAGPQSARGFASSIRGAAARHASVLDALRGARRARDADRNLRAEQASAYERSLATDREKLARRRAEEAAARRAAEEEQRRTKAREERARTLRRWRRWRAARLRPEPASDDPGATRLSLRLPGGQRVVRRFAGAAPLEELYAFVECRGLAEAEEEEEMDEKADGERPEGYEHAYGFRLVAPMPRAVYDVAGGGTVAERVGRSGNLIVEMKEDDEDED